MPINSKNKGNKYERQIMNELKDIFPDVKTSRYANREKDDEKVDLVNTDPLNIQCKCTEKAPNMHTLLNQMPDDSNYNVVFHKRNRMGSTVTMMAEDFYELLQSMKQEGII